MHSAAVSGLTWFYHKLSPCRQHSLYHRPTGVLCVKALDKLRINNHGLLCYDIHYIHIIWDSHRCMDGESIWQNEPEVRGKKNLLYSVNGSLINHGGALLAKVQCYDAICKKDDRFIHCELYYSLVIVIHEGAHPSNMRLWMRVRKTTFYFPHSIFHSDLCSWTVQWDFHEIKAAQHSNSN